MQKASKSFDRDSRFCQGEGILLNLKDGHHATRIRFTGRGIPLFSEVLTNESRVSLRKFRRFKAA